MVADWGSEIEKNILAIWMVDDLGLGLAYTSTVLRGAVPGGKLLTFAIICQLCR